MVRKRWRLWKLSNRYGYPRHYDAPARRLGIVQGDQAFRFEYSSLNGNGQGRIGSKGEGIPARNG